MCGIVGIVDKTQKDLNRLDLMLDVIYKRGPDGDGKYFDKYIALGMRRLSIIDLEHGFQPFFSDNKNIVAFQNGEIYNYIELRKELQKYGYEFKSNSDTEVLAHGYHKWGIEGLLERLEGMYVFVVLDKRAQKLYIARDRFGEKPLYFYGSKEKFAYASDLRAILKLNWVEKKYDKVAISKYLLLGFNQSSNSIIKDIKKLPPASFLMLDLNSFELNLSCYYVPNIYSAIQNKLSFEEKLSLLEEKLLNSIDLRLRSDVPVGIFLSGGIDSSLIAALASKKQKLKTFSIGFYSDIHDESRYAKKVAKHLNTEHYHFMFDEKKFVELLEAVVDELDEPLADQALLPTYWLSKEAVKYVKVVLSGEGGDEVFGGYGYYKNYIKNYPFEKLILNSHLASGFPLIASEKMLKGLLKNPEINTQEDNELMDLILSANYPVKKAMAADLLTWLPNDLLVKLDRMTMANSLEGRVPYLSHHVVDFSYSLSPKDWIAGESKHILRTLARKYLPKEIFQRPKQGFVLPMDEWVRNWFKSKGVERYIIENEIDKIDSNVMIKYIKQELNKKHLNQRFLFAVIMLYEWNKRLVNI